MRRQVKKPRSSRHDIGRSVICVARVGPWGGRGGGPERRNPWYSMSHIDHRHLSCLEFVAVNELQVLLKNCIDISQQISSRGSNRGRECRRTWTWGQRAGAAGGEPCRLRGDTRDEARAEDEQDVSMRQAWRSRTARAVRARAEARRVGPTAAARAVAARAMTKTVAATRAAVGRAAAGAAMGRVAARAAAKKGRRRRGRRRGPRW